MLGCLLPPNFFSLNISRSSLKLEFSLRLMATCGYPWFLRILPTYIQLVSKSTIWSLLPPSLLLLRAELLSCLLFCVLFIYLFFSGIRVWIQDLTLVRQALLLEPLYQPIFVLGIFEIRSQELFAQRWPCNTILLISALRVAKILGMSHWRPARVLLWCFFVVTISSLALTYDNVDTSQLKAFRLWDYSS
jgi:hypothetical protein